MNRGTAMLRQLSIASMLLLLAGCVSYYPAYRDDYGYYDGGYEGEYYEDDGYGYGSTAYPYANDYYGASYYPTFWSLGYGSSCGGYYHYACGPYGYGSGWSLSFGFGGGYPYYGAYYGGGYPYYGGYGGYGGGWYAGWYDHHHHHHDHDDDDYDGDRPDERSIPGKPAHREDMASRTAPGEYLRPTQSRYGGYRQATPRQPNAGPGAPMSKPQPYRGTPNRRYREPTAPGDAGPVPSYERPMQRPNVERPMPRQDYERQASRPRYAESAGEPRYEVQQPRAERSMPRPQQPERSYERPQPSYERAEPRAERAQVSRPAMRETRAPSQNEDRDSEL